MVQPISSKPSSFAIRHGLLIAFLCAVLCLAGIYAALGMPSSIFPQTNFPRVVILIVNGVMPANEMMATITRPVEEAMKDIPGVRTVRSKTGRGSAEVNVFFHLANGYDSSGAFRPGLACGRAESVTHHSEFGSLAPDVCRVPSDWSQP